MYLQKESESELGAQLLTKLKVKTVYFLYFVLNL